jgi:hypothetical protein
MQTYNRGILAEHIEIRVSPGALLADRAVLLFGGDDELWWDEYCRR